MNKPEISIIIPVYNIEKYLSRCLDSILNQTFSDYEIILINDGSTDSSGAIADNYAKNDSRIKVIHKENGGVSSARFAGVRKATGQYIGFVDGDDIIEPDMFEILLNNAKNFNADISHCGYKMVFPDGRTDFYYNTGKVIEQDNFNGKKDLLEGIFIEPGLWNKLYKTEIVKTVILNNQIDTSIKINEDLLMNYCLFENAEKSVYEDKCLYHYMVHKNSAATSKINSNKLCDPIKVIEILMQKTSEDLELHKICESRYARILIYTATLSLNNNAKLIKPIRMKARKTLRKHLMTFLKNNYISKKLKIMCIWAAIYPQSYSLIHTLHSKITGTDKKYAV